jgi:hypothetical protein
MKPIDHVHYPIHVCRCHNDVGGANLACCQNQDEPDALPNPHEFSKRICSIAKDCMNRWFEDDDPLIGMCRVTNFFGLKNVKGEYEPMLEYVHMVNGKPVNENSTFSEVQLWVSEEKSNL